MTQEAQKQDKIRMETVMAMNALKNVTIIHIGTRAIGRTWQYLLPKKNTVPFTSILALTGIQKVTFLLCMFNSYLEVNPFTCVIDYVEKWIEVEAS